MTTLFEFNYSTVNTQLGSHVLQVYNMFKIVFKVLIAWLVVNTRLIFIGCRQGCDYSSEKVRLMLKSHSCKPMKSQYLPMITEDQ